MITVIEHRPQITRTLQPNKFNDHNFSLLTRHGSITVEFSCCLCRCVLVQLLMWQSHQKKKVQLWLCLGYVVGLCPHCFLLLTYLILLGKWPTCIVLFSFPREKTYDPKIIQKELYKMQVNLYTHQRLFIVCPSKVTFATSIMASMGKSMTLFLLLELMSL